MPNDELGPRIPGFPELDTIVDPVLADFLSAFDKALRKAAASSEAEERTSHFDAVWEACSVSRSIRLHLGVLANAEQADADAVAILYEEAERIDHRAEWYSDEKQHELYVACRDNINSRFDLLRDGTMKLIAG